jgi:hypothetical protein
MNERTYAFGGTMKVQAQTLTTLSIGSRTYRLLDIRVNSGVADMEIPILRDETGRLCVFSRIVSTIMGYRQKDTLYRMVTQRGHGAFNEGVHYRLEHASDFRVLLQLENVFPALSCLRRLRSEEALLYTKSFPLFVRYTKIHSEGVLSLVTEAEEALQATSEISEEESLVDKLTDDLAPDPDSEKKGTIGPDLPPIDHVHTLIIPGPLSGNSGAPPTALKTLGQQSQSSPPALKGPLEDVTLDEESDPEPPGVGPTFRGGVPDEEILKEVEALAESADVEVGPGELTRMLTKPEAAPEPKAPSPFKGILAEEELDQILDPGDIALGDVWEPPGYPEDFDDAAGFWLASVYAWALRHQTNPQRVSLGANIPNLPRVLVTIMERLGFLEHGTPDGPGKLFLYREANGTIRYNTKIVARILCVFLASNTDLDYRNLLPGCETPVKINSHHVLRDLKKMGVIRVTPTNGDPNKDTPQYLPEG